MAKRKPIDKPIPNLDTAWDNGTEAYTGQRVESFIKEQFLIRAAAQYFDPTTMVLLGFASEADKQTYLENGDSTLITASTPFSFSGTLRQVKVTPTSGSANIYFTTTQNEAIVAVNLIAQEKGLTDSEWTPSLEDFRVSVAVDRGAQGNYETIRSDELVLNGNGYEINVRDYLQSGNNRVKIIAEGVQSGEKGTLVLQCYLTTMYLEASDFRWYSPFVEGNVYQLGGMKIGGNLPKTLNIVMANEAGYFKRYEVNIGTATYINTAYHFTELDFPSGGTGVYNVDIWLTAEGIESAHLKYNLMCIAAADVMTAQLVAICDIKNPVVNYAENTLLKYACYNQGAATADITLDCRALINQSPTTVRRGTMTGIPTASEQSLVVSLELETEETNLKLETSLKLLECEQKAIAEIDNSHSYPAASGATFYINPASRDNSNSNREMIINAAAPQAEPLAAEWTNMAWTSDGWTTDASGRKCLLIPAGCRCVIPISMLSSNQSRSIELAYKVDNIADYNEPIITISEDVSDYWVGIKALPTRVIMHSNALHSNDLQQSYDLTEGSLNDIIFAIAKPYKSAAYGNVAFIYCNGVKKCSFPYSTTDSFVSNGNLVLGSDSADLYIYKIRLYENALEANDACKNFVNSLPTTDEKAAAQSEIDSVINDSYKVDYDLVVGKKNTMVIEMLNGATLPKYGMSKEYTARSNVDFNFILPYTYEGKKYTSWGFRLANVEHSGQGSTSMNYWVWNQRMRPDKTKSPNCEISYADGRPNSDNKHVIFDPTSEHPSVGRITAKKNYASSPQSHKIGATAAFNALHDKVLGERDDHTCVAVYQKPVYGFLKEPIEGTSQYTYTFIGLYTVGPDKGDKNTFGYSGDEELVLEGLNHNIMGVGYDYPWSELEYVHANEAICVKRDGGNYDKAIEVSQAGSAEDATAITYKLDTEFGPAYEMVYNNSPLIMGVTETLDEINADVSAWRQRKDADGHSYQRYEFWTDGVYDLYYYNVRTGLYESNGVNLADQCGFDESTLAAKTIAEKNELFVNWRIDNFRQNARDYWDEDDNLFCIAFLFIMGASDNFKKNTYPQKLKLLANGGRWGQRQDDLDTIFATDNQGLNSKSYSIEIFDWTDSAKTAYVFKGEDSRWVQLFVRAFPTEFISMGNRILSAMYELGGGSNTLDRLKGFFTTYFFDNAQNYFSKSAYNHDAEISYEEAYPNYVSGNYSVDVSPLAQSKGDATEAEREWLEKRLVYTCSLFGFGFFGSASDASCGRITFRTQLAQDFTLTPAIDLYPAIAYGESNSKQAAQQRIKAGDAVTLSQVGGNNTNVYIMGSDWLADIGDLSKLAVDASSDAPIAVSGKRLLKLKFGDEDAEEVTSNLATINLGTLPSLTEIDARNLASLTGDIDMRQCARLKRALLGGTSLTSASIAPGSRIEILDLPNTLQSLDLRNLAALRDFVFSGLTNLTYLRIEGCLSDSAFDILKQNYNAEDSRLRDIRLIGFEYDGDATDTQMLANLANDLDEKGKRKYHGINSEGVADDSLLPVVEGVLNVEGSIYRQDGEDIEKNYPRLTLNVSGGYYMAFADPEVLRVMATTYGDGNGITEAAVFSLTNLGVEFKQNTSIETFDELADFSSLTSIADDAFNSCTSLTSVELPTSLTNIGFRAFAYCSQLSLEVNLPNLTSLGGAAFSGTAITSVTNLGSITTTPEKYTIGMFTNCTSLSSVNLPSTLTTIGKMCFKNCSSLTSISLPNSVQNILESAFLATGLTSITIPNGVQLIGNYAFSECPSLSHVDMPNTVTEIGTYCFSKCASLTSITLPSSLITIGSSAFANTGITGELVIPQSVITIGEIAFGGCKFLSSVIISQSVTSIGRIAFYNCSSLNTVVCHAVTPPSLGSGVFPENNSALIIYVPDASVEDYKNASGWSSHASKIKGISELPTD